MNFEKLKNSLNVDGQYDITIEKGCLGAAVDTLIATCYANSYNNNQPSIVIHGAAITPNTDTIDVTGTSEFLITSFDQSLAALNVTATFSLDGDGEPQLLLRYFLPQADPRHWKFSNSFPCLPTFTDWTQPVNESAIQLLDEFCLSNSAFVVSTQACSDPQTKALLEPGINFVSYLDPGAVLGLLASIFGQGSSLLVYGRIILPQEGEKLDDRDSFDSPWAAKIPPATPGIWLTVQLASVSLGANAFDNFNLRIYSPIDTAWQEQNSTYTPLCAFTGELTISEKVKIALIAEYEVGAEEIYLEGIGQGLSIANLSELFSISGPGDHCSALPGDLASLVQGLSQIELQRAGLGLSLEGSSPKITYCMFAIGLSSIHWSIWEDHFALTALSCKFEIDNPFDSAARELNVTLTAKTEIEGVEVDVSASSREGFTFYASLANVDIPLNSLINSFGPGFTLPDTLSDPHIDALRVSIAPMKSYGFALFMAGNSKPWLITHGALSLEISDIILSLDYPNGGPAAGVFAGTFNLNQIGTFSCRYDLHEFSASTGPGQELPIGRLIVWLNDQFGTGTGDVPAAISSLTLDDLSLAFNTGKSGHFAFKGSAAFEANGNAAKISVTIDVSGKEKTIGAQVTIGDEQFEVHFDDQKVGVGADKSQDYESALIALYDHKQEGGQETPAPNLRNMVAAFSQDLSEVMPDIAIDKAVFGYYSARQGEKTTSAWLFGVELGAMDFSIGDPNQPIVSALLGSDLSFGIDSPQLLLTTQALSHDVLAKLHSLGENFKLPESGLKSACFTASLKLGGQTYPLMLNLGEEDASAASSGTNPAGGSRELTGGTPEPAAAAPDSDVKWIKLQKQISVLYFDKVGIRYKSGTLALLLSASLTASGLTISLDGFSIESPLNAFNPTFDLSGLGIRYKADPVEISGAFLKSGQGEDMRYSGQALVKAESFMLSAIGSYAKTKDSPSLFIFAFLDAKLGGPPCFYVTGLAAGFGYNSSVRVPDIQQVKDFPLLAAMQDPSKIGGKDASPKDALDKLDAYVSPQPGSTWLAAGISFRSFDMIESQVLAIAEFGKEFQLLIVGTSNLKLPKEGKTTYARGELVIQILIKPSEGLIAAMAQLTPNSYLIDPACHLTGGAAFYLWFGSNPHAGDFVLTIGGYHPAFSVPDWYPQRKQVPRLGFNWLVSSNVTIKGEAYFALVPSCVMAGGSLEVVYQSGNLKAWFIAHADMIISWNPFYFDAGISIRVGVSYRIHVWFINVTLSAELGASLELWGPPTGGRASISCGFISFTVSFGADKITGSKYIEWKEFKALLPQARQEPSGARGLLAASPDTDPDLSIIQIRVNDGLLQQVGDKTSSPRWIVRPDEFVFSIETSVPLTIPFTLKTEVAPKTPVSTNQRSDIGIRPMGIPSITSQLKVSIQKSGGSGSLDDWDYEIQTRSMPASMWGVDSVQGSPPNTESKLAEAKLVDKCQVGIKNVRPKPGMILSGPPEFVMENTFASTAIDLQADYLPLAAAASNTMVELPASGDSLKRIQTTLMDGDVVKKRAAVSGALAGWVRNVWTDGDLTALAADAAGAYRADPMIGNPVAE
jgi:hypothetical protein